MAIVKTHRVMIVGMDAQGMSGLPDAHTHFQADCGRVVPNERAAESEPSCIQCLEAVGRIQERP